MFRLIKKSYIKINKLNKTCTYFLKILSNRLFFLNKLKNVKCARLQKEFFKFKKNSKP